MPAKSVVVTRTDAWKRIRVGFTLIELLMVVAIIAILAVIAVPNFLEAQVRAKVSRTKSDMRTVICGIESYCVDCNQYPPQPTSSLQWAWQMQLTTPIAYLSNKFPDVFCPPADMHNRFYQYSMCPKMKSWIMVSVGPDQTDSFDETVWMCGMVATYPPLYDATNGTVSRGDVIRLCKQGGPPPPGYRNL